MSDPAKILTAEDVLTSIRRLLAQEAAGPAAAAPVAAQPAVPPAAPPVVAPVAPAVSAAQPAPQAAPLVLTPDFRVEAAAQPVAPVPEAAPSLEDTLAALEAAITSRFGITPAPAAPAPEPPAPEPTLAAAEEEVAEAPFIAVDMPDAPAPVAFRHTAEIRRLQLVPSPVEPAARAEPAEESAPVESAPVESTPVAAEAGAPVLASLPEPQDSALLPQSEPDPAPAFDTIAAVEEPAIAAADAVSAVAPSLAPDALVEEPAPVTEPVGEAGLLTAPDASLADHGGAALPNLPEARVESPALPEPAPIAGELDPVAEAEPFGGESDETRSAAFAEDLPQAAALASAGAEAALDTPAFDAPAFEAPAVMPAAALQPSAPDLSGDELAHFSDALGGAPEAGPGAPRRPGQGTGEEGEPLLFDAPEEVSVSLDAIRQIVGEILREELQGTLGERMTRNVRKLVRAEIRRALAERDDF